MFTKLLTLSALLALAVADVKELSHDYLPPKADMVVSQEYLPSKSGVDVSTYKQQDDLDDNHIEVTPLTSSQARQAFGFPGGYQGGYPGAGGFPGSFPFAGGFPGPGGFASPGGFPPQGFVQPGFGGQALFPGQGYPSGGLGFNGFPGQGFLSPGFVLGGYPRPGFDGYPVYFSQQLKQEDKAENQNENGDARVAHDTTYDSDNGGYLYNKPNKRF